MVIFSIWNKNHHNSDMTKLIKPIYILLLLVLLQSTLSYCFLLSHFYELKTSGADSASFIQLFHNLVNGYGMISSTSPPYISQHWFGFHFSPILYTIAPIYWLFPSPKTLFLLHTILISSATIPLFFTCKKIFSSSWQSLVICIFYLINPLIINAQIFDFHEMAFAPLFITIILWSIINNNKIWFIIFCFLLLTIKEHYGLSVFGAGILWAYHNRDIKFGLSASLIGLASFLIIIKIIMPYFHPDTSLAMLNSSANTNYFGWIFTPFADPELLGKRLVESIFYIFLMIYPLWFQPLLAPLWMLPALADIFINSVSNNDMLRHPSAYHSAPIVPVLLIAYCVVIAKRYNQITKIKRWEFIAATALMVGFYSYSLTSLPHLPNNIWELSSIKSDYSQGDKKSISDINNIIGGDSIISVQDNIMPHIATRRYLYMFPNESEQTEDYIIINTRNPFLKHFHAFGTPYVEDEFITYLNKIHELINNRHWKIKYYSDNWLLLKRNDKNDTDDVSDTNNQEIKNQLESDLEQLKIKQDKLDKITKRN
ncbi:MAG: DUF2079 domain-containing protein [Rickettsiales bacterium]